MDLESIDKLNDVINLLKKSKDKQLLSYPLKCYKCNEILYLTQCIYNYCPNIICKNCAHVVNNKSYCDNHTKIP